MSKLSRFYIIFFAIVLLYSGISKDYYNGLLNLNNKNADTEHSFLYSLENTNCLYYTHRQGENLINFTNHLLFPNFKIILTIYAENSFALELKLLNSIHQYFAFSKIISQSLPIQLIIFPFHFFG